MLSPPPAFASQGTGACSDSGNTVGCTAGTGGSGGTGTTGGSGATTTGDNSGGGTTAPSCPNYVADPQGGAPPAGENPNGAWYINTCAVGTPQGMATGIVWIVNNQPPPPPPPDPAVVAAQADSQLQLATPTLTFSPAATAYVNFPEWLWINPAIWHPFTTSATACNAGGCTTVAATATPVYVTWDTGDMAPVTVCYGPGTPYDASVPYLRAIDPVLAHLRDQLLWRAVPERPGSRRGLPDHRHCQLERDLGRPRRFHRPTRGHQYQRNVHLESATDRIRPEVRKNL